jgi:hypothetical protein
MSSEGCTGWAHAAAEREWRARRGQPLANRDLWERLLELAGSLTVTWRRMRAHRPIKDMSDDARYNREVDSMAGAARRDLDVPATERPAGLPLLATAKNRQRRSTVAELLLHLTSWPVRSQASSPAQVPSSRRRNPTPPAEIRRPVCSIVSGTMSVRRRRSMRASQGCFESLGWQGPPTSPFSSAEKFLRRFAKPLRSRFQRFQAQNATDLSHPRASVAGHHLSAFL